MVRVNLINPRNLADQHLIAEYAEILMLAAYIKKHSSLDNLPKKYCLGKGHMRFFKDKLKYLKTRHELIKKEMKKRGFKPRKALDISKFQKNFLNEFSPKKEDFKIIKKRLTAKIRFKPDFYRYYGKKKSTSFLLNLLKK